MRLHFFHDTGSHPADLESRLEAWLALLKEPTPPRAQTNSEPLFASAEEAALWAGFVERSQPIEPVTTTTGLEAAVQWRNAAMTSDDTAWSLTSLQANAGARVVGPRAGVRSRLSRGVPRLPTGDRWRLALSCDDAEATRLTKIFWKTFATADRRPGAIAVGEPHPVVPFAVSVVARLAFGVTDGETLVKLWQKATALGVVEQWLKMLAPHQQYRLADQLAQELTAAGAVLHWRVDLDLAGFAEGASYNPRPPMFATRLDELFWSQALLDRLHDTLAPDFAFGDMASSVALVGAAGQVGNLLRALPPGRAYFSAVRTLRRRRPQILASLLAHVSFAPDAMFALSDWPDTFIQVRRRITMHDEWLEMVALARRLALFHDRGPHYPTAIAWAVHEEAFENDPRERWHQFTPVPPTSIRMEPWRERLVPDDDADLAVDASAQRLRSAPTDPELVFALRLVAILEQPHALQAARLAGAIVDAYAARLSLSPRELRNAPQLARHGELLAVLNRVLRASDGEQWQRWCVPFDVIALVQRTHEEAKCPASSENIDPQYHPPQYVYEHASHLLAAADALSGTEKIELAECFARLFEQTHGKMEGDPWVWHYRTAGVTQSSPMERLGRILQAFPEHVSAELIERLDAARATELHLAELLAGLGRGVALANTLERRVHLRARLLLEQGGIAVGKACQLAVALHGAGILPLAEQYASYVLKVLNEPPRYQLAHLRSAALKVLLASWIGQQKWAEFETADLASDDPEKQAFVSNLRAVAELECGRTSDSLARLQDILKRDPMDALALVNIAAVYAERSEWGSCLDACAHARRVLGDAAPPEVSGNEARAYYGLRDFRRAAAALDRWPADRAPTPEMIKLRVALAITTVPVLSQIEDDLRALDQTDAAMADRLRTRLAPLSDGELGGGWFAPGALSRRFVSFSERCAAQFQEPENILLRAIGSAAQRIAEQPALAQDLNEDQLTRLLCAYLVVLERHRIYANTLVGGGWGPKKEGIADFALTEMSDQGLEHGRPVVRGEAKRWDGPAWMTKGMQQVFGTANTGQELFLVLVIYSQAPVFETVVQSTRESLRTFDSDGTGEFATLEAPEEVSVMSGRCVRIFKTLHGDKSSGSRPTRLYTVVVDVVSERSRTVRRVSSTMPPSAKLSASPRASGQRKTRAGTRKPRAKKVAFGYKHQKNQ